MVERTRQESREAFILHGYPYRETSLLLETFTRAFGRVSMVARGARSPRSPLRGVLLAFQPLALSWFGKGELRTLARAEWVGGQPLLHGEALMCGFYLNELLLRLLPREDPHDALFSRYWETLRRLAPHGSSAPHCVLSREPCSRSSVTPWRSSATAQAVARSIRRRAIRTIPSADRSRSRTRDRSLACPAGRFSTWRATTMPIHRLSNRRRH